MKTIAVAGQADIVKRASNAQRRRVRGRTNTVPSVVADNGVPDVELHVACFVNEYSLIGKSEDYTVLHIYRFSLKNIHAADAVTEPVDGNTSNRDYVCRGRVDDDTRCERSQDRRHRAR